MAYMRSHKGVTTMATCLLIICFLFAAHDSMKKKRGEKD
jgi:hypothetical protein